jgi:hypothetical protein
LDHHSHGRDWSAAGVVARLTLLRVCVWLLLVDRLAGCIQWLFHRELIAEGLRKIRKIIMEQCAMDNMSYHHPIEPAVNDVGP